jgi:UDP:flavonoid glycosyltransferase YjiC (YdhE family)
MKRCLFTTLPSNDLGLLTRALPIAKELAGFGFEVSFCHPAKSPGLLIKEAGFKNFISEASLFRLVSAEINLQSLSKFVFSKNVLRYTTSLIHFLQVQAKHSTDEIWNIDHFMIFFGMLNEEFIRLGVEDHIEMIKSTGAEAVIDFWNPFACIAARILNLPLISIIQAEMHPQSEGFIWWKEKPNDLPSPAGAIKGVLRHYDLPSIDRTGELFLGDKTLVVGIPELDPLPEAANVTYIGPVLWQKDEAELPAWINKLDENIPIIWVYPGNMQYAKGAKSAFDSQIVLDASIGAFAGQNVQVVVTTGHHELPGKYHSLPSNFQHADFVPGLAMARKSDLLVHHGGYGSCQTGLFTGTPALIIPTFSERESNARRIASVKAGDYILPKSDSRGFDKQVNPDLVREKAMRILSDPVYLKNARDIQQKFESYGGAILAAELITEVI